MRSPLDATGYIRAAPERNESRAVLCCQLNDPDHVVVSSRINDEVRGGVDDPRTQPGNVPIAASVTMNQTIVVVTSDVAVPHNHSQRARE